MTPRIRCAVYTRKSSEEGLEQSFNSLHAQREACEAFIRSQKHEGWALVTTSYDDGGFSGGNMDRPALRALMADIGEGKVNTVVVYKVDRLTRSLADFAKIIEQFDARGVNFVSVTQQFNTTTSMGRLTLNVLLSFAQFEREVTGERIRDKIAASKAKGMWMGGTVPLGYDLRDRRLYVNSQEAECVREIFRQYLRLRTVPALTSYMRQSGVRTKIRIRRNEKTGGGYYSRGALYQLLRNHLYVGEIEHKGSIYQGQHEAILDRELWEQVQRLLDENRQGTRRRLRGSSGSILTGLLFGESGARYIPTSAHKSGRRYHYYTSQARIKGERNDRSMERLPGPALEAAVTERILKFLQSPAEVLDAVKRLEASDINCDRILKNARQRASGWPSLTQAEKADLIRALLHRVVVHESSIELQLDIDSIVRLLLEKPISEGVHNGHAQTICLDVPFRHIPQGKALKLVIGNGGSDSSASKEAIARAIARARSWYELIIAGKATGLSDLARQHGLTHRYVKNIFPLAFLSPRSIELLLSCRDSQPRTLKSVKGKVPICWGVQKSYFANLQPGAQ